MRNLNVGKEMSQLSLMARLLLFLRSLFSWVPVIIAFFGGRQSVLKEQQDNVIKLKTEYVKTTVNHNGERKRVVERLRDEDDKW